MKVKRLGLLAAAAVLSLTMVGCGSQNKEADKKEDVKFETVETDTVKKALKDSNYVVVDARGTDSYMGWKLNGDKRGGHLPNATDFASDWLTCEYDEKENLEGKTREEVLKEAMENKDIKPDKNVIVYSTGKADDANQVAGYFKKHGIKNISVYDATNWVNDEKEPLESYKDYSLLLPASYVKDITEGKQVETISDPKNVKIFDVRWGDNKNSGYLDGHVPGAVHINTDSFEPPKEVNGNKTWLLADDETLAKLLLDNGITSKDTVIVTGPEPMAACRFATICKYMGVKDVRVMDGGLVTWKANGYDLSKDEVKPEKATDFGVKYPANPQYIVSIPQLKDMMKNEKGKFELCDDRMWDEYIGKISGYDYHKLKGRIEGAKFANAGIKSSSSMYYYRNIDKTMRNEKEIIKMWEKGGIDPNKDMVFMCGSGWRAAEAMWYAHTMGLKAQLYSDGWIGWSLYGNPSVTGEEKK